MTHDCQVVSAYTDDTRTAQKSERDRVRAFRERLKLCDFAALALSVGEAHASERDNGSRFVWTAFDVESFVKCGDEDRDMLAQAIDRVEMLLDELRALQTFEALETCERCKSALSNERYPMSHGPAVSIRYGAESRACHESSQSGK